MGVITPTIFMRTAVTQLYSAIWLSRHADEFLYNRPRRGWFDWELIFRDGPEDWEVRVEVR